MEEFKTKMESFIKDKIQKLRTENSGNYIEQHLTRLQINQEVIEEISRLLKESNPIQSQELNDYIYDASTRIMNA